MVVLLKKTVMFAAVLALNWWFTSATPTGELNIWLTIVAHILRAALAMSFVLFVDACVRVFFWNGYVARILGAKVPRLLPLTVSIVLYVSTLLNLLKHDYNLSIGGALAASGFVAVILGFALRSVILDLFTGLAVSIDRSYMVGDWITVTSRDFVEPVYGQVEEIDWRTTRMRREDNTLFVMPNSLGGAFSITNHSKPRGPKRLEVVVLLPHEAPQQRVMHLLHGVTIKAMELDGFATKPAPYILIGDITRDGVEYIIRFYADIHEHRPSRARSHVLKAIHSAVLQNDLEFAGEKIEVQNRRLSTEKVECTQVRRIKALQNAPLFSQAMNDEELCDLSSSTECRSVDEGAALITQGDEGDSLFLVLSGAASVHYTHEDKPSFRLAMLSTGDIVGEMSLMTGKPRSASVIADTPLDVMEIRKQDIKKILQARPGIAETLSQLLAERHAAQENANGVEKPSTDQNEKVRLGLLKAMRRFFKL